MRELLAIDVAEIFPPKQVNECAKNHEWPDGWSDLRMTDEHGKPWNFSDPSMRNKAARRFIEEKPTLLVGSPSCTCFSHLMKMIGPG